MFYLAEYQKFPTTEVQDKYLQCQRINDKINDNISDLDGKSSCKVYYFPLRKYSELKVGYFWLFDRKPLEFWALTDHGIDDSVPG